MNSISEILENQYADQGIQDLRVFFDSFIFNLKVKDGASYNNVLLIEKIAFDYDKESLVRTKNPIQVNFGDTGLALPYFSNGNCFVDSFLDRKRNVVLLIGLKKMANGNTIPVIFQYDVNRHQVKPIFPNQTDIDQFNSFDNFTFKQDARPVVKFLDSKLFILFQTQDSTFNYVNRLRLDVNKEVVTLEDYAVYTYSAANDIDFTNANADFLNFKLGDYHGVLVKLQEGDVVENPSIYALDDTFSIYSFDSTSVLRLDE